MKLNIKLCIIYFSNWFIVVLPLIILSGYINEYVCAMLSTAVHEFGHAFTAKLKGCRLKSIKVTPAGLNAEIDELSCSKRDLILIYICGPFVNLLIAAIAFIISLFFYNIRQLFINFIMLNVFLAVFNLLPALPLDGGKILFETLSGCFGITTAEKYSTRAAIFLSIVFIIAGFCQLIMNWGNFSLFIIGIFVLTSLINGRMEASFMNIKQIIYRRSRLLKKGIYPVRDIVALKWMRLGECVKCMDYDRFHMVHVMDDDMKVIAIFTESEIIEAMLAYTSDLTFEELVKLDKAMQ